MIKTLTEPAVKKTVYTATALLSALLLWLAWQQPPGDFGNYYFGSCMWVDGNSWFLQDIYFFNTKIRTCYGYKDLFLDYIPVPPFSLPFYFPFSFLIPDVAKLLWNVISLGLFLFSLTRLTRFKGLSIWWLPVVLFAVLIPIKNNLDLGQSYLFIFFLMAEGLLAYEKDRKWLSALCWALALHLKIFPGIVLFFLLFRKDWKTSGLYLLCSALVLLLTAWLTGFETVRHYISEVLPRLSRGEINNTYAQSYQSMQVLLKNLLYPDAMHNPDAAWNNIPLFLHLDVFYKVSILLLTIAMRSRFNTLLQSFSSWVLASLLISGYGTNYSLVLLIFPLLALTDTGTTKKWQTASVLLLVLLIASIPVYRFTHLPLLLQFPRLWLLLILFGWYVYKFRPVWNKTTLAFALAGIVFAVWPREEKEDNTSYFLQKEEALLIRRYAFAGDIVTLYTYNERGQQNITIPSGFHVRKTEQVGLDKLPEATDKRYILPGSACVVNDSLFVFLSDRNRGVGFYTLRKVPVNDTGR